MVASSILARCIYLVGFGRARALQQLDNKRACHHQCGPTCGRQLQGKRQARSAVHSAVMYEIARQPAARTWKRSKVVDKSSDEVVDLQVLASKGNPATRNRTRDHLIAAWLYSQMLYQLSYSRIGRQLTAWSEQFGGESIEASSPIAIFATLCTWCD